ncbi:MAG: ATP-binding protein [Pseudomonadota bacterium]
MRNWSEAQLAAGARPIAEASVGVLGTLSITRLLLIGAAVALCVAALVVLGASLGPIGAAGLVGVAVGAATVGLVLCLRRAARASAFDEFFKTAAHAVVLTDRRGRILRANPAVDPAAVDLSSWLGLSSEDGAALIYDIGKRARDAGLADQDITRHGVRHILRARDAGEGRQIWQLARAPAVALLPSADAASEDLLDQLPIGIARLQEDGEITYLNAAAHALLGPRGVPGAVASDLMEGLHKSIAERLSDTVAGRDPGRAEVARAERDGAEVFLQVTMIRVTEDGAPAVLAVFADATELKTLEAQFVQSQKMQAVGQLAGGIAHDFNNLLTAIHGHCDLLLLRHDNGDPDHGDLVQIRQNANRAAALVRQLLAFSRKQTLRLTVLHLFDTMAELAHLLNRLLGERVELKIENLEDIWPVRVDERQLEQVVVNLVVNARDAMPDGGVVMLRTKNVELEEMLHRDRAIVPAGRYCVIEVEDTGIGIAANQLDKVFEPFYTTKRIGEGTGLGLSTAYGIVKQSRGFIFVDSAVGVGTKFSIYIPVYEGAEAAKGDDRSAGTTEGDSADLTGRGIVLLVEDEAPVRSFAARALRMRGYEVIEADCGEAALEVVRDTSVHIDLFISDVIMPGLDGPSWVREALEMRAGVSTIFVSGYAEEAFNLDKDEIPHSSFLPKPFSLNDLTARVREHMDQFASSS